jgi:hypothetical protein
MPAFGPGYLSAGRTSAAETTGNNINPSANGDSKTIATGSRGDAAANHDNSVFAD